MFYYGVGALRERTGSGVGGSGGFGSPTIDPDVRVQRAAAAADEILKTRDKLDADLAQQLIGQLQALKADLLANIFMPMSTRQVTSSKVLSDRVDQIIARISARMVQAATSTSTQMIQLGDAYVTEPLDAAGLVIARTLPAYDNTLVDAAEGNMVDLLSPPMQQFASHIKVALRGIVLGSENRSDAYEKLVEIIERSGFEDAAYRSERVIRTEVGRTFTGATHGRMQQVGEKMPFIRKTWRATMDDRTRLGHAEAADTYAEGKGIPVNEPFYVRVYRETKKATTLLGTVKMMYPLDPNASPAGDLAAAATINCRCNQTIDFAMDDFRAYARKSLAFG